LAGCLASLERQTLALQISDAFEIIVVDNSGSGLVGSLFPSGGPDGGRMRVITNPRNVGFGSAVNQAVRDSTSPYVATLNDDAVAEPRWLEALLQAADANPQAGMFASEVRLEGGELLDSAGMLIAADGTGKQRGHRQLVSGFTATRESLFPSGSAALYRRTMLDQIGLFDESFFIYCEDVDLGLRAQWANWECIYVPGAVVEHSYSHSAGRASPLKAYYVERNRLYAIIKNFPLGLLWRAPFVSAARYLWHVISLDTGQGKTSEFRQAGHAFALLPFLVLRAHASAFLRLPRLLRERRRIRASRRIQVRQFVELLSRHAISVRQVATL
jgi:GT2 family glycosyltransferase